MFFFRVPVTNAHPGAIHAATRGATTQETRTRVRCKSSNEFGWNIEDLKASNASASGQVREVPVSDIRRPLGKVRSNDQRKVEALKRSIVEHGLLEPIDVLEVDGIIYGFSGCHRYQAHVELGADTIKCRVRPATKATLKMHMM